jgi:hypothetical protein
MVANTRGGYLQKVTENIGEDQHNSVVYQEPACHHSRAREMEIFPDSAIDVVQACKK